MKPIEDKIIVLPDPPKTETESGLIIPNVAVEIPNRGTVEAVGEGIPDYPMILKPGDKVYYSRGVGNLFSVEGKTFIIMRQSDILMIE